MTSAMFYNKSSRVIYWRILQNEDFRLSLTPMKLLRFQLSICMLPKHLVAALFIYRWPWVEGQYIRTIIMPCVCIEISPITIYVFITEAYSGHILESAKGIEMKLGLYIDASERKDMYNNIIIPVYYWVILS